MGEKLDVNKILTGSGGNVWFNGRKLATVQKVEAKMTGKFEEVEVCGDEETYQRYNGWSGTGTLTLLKVDSEISKLVSDGYISGIMPQIKIITSLQNKATKKAERGAFVGITVDEIIVAAFYKKTKTT